MEALRGRGAAGELTGWVLDTDGRPLDHEINGRVTSIPLRSDPDRPIIGVAGGTGKLGAIRAALRGRWLSGLVTDAAVAAALLE